MISHKTKVHTLKGPVILRNKVSAPLPKADTNLNQPFKLLKKHYQL